MGRKSRRKKAKAHKSKINDKSAKSLARQGESITTIEALKKRLHSHHHTNLQKAAAILHFLDNNGPFNKLWEAFLLCQSSFISIIESQQITVWDKAHPDMLAKGIALELVNESQVETLRLLDSLRRGQVNNYSLSPLKNKAHEEVLKLSLKAMRTKSNDPSSYRKTVKKQLTPLFKNSESAQAIADLLRLFVAQQGQHKTQVVKRLREFGNHRSSLRLTTAYLAEQTNKLNQLGHERQPSLRGTFLHWLALKELGSGNYWIEHRLEQDIDTDFYFAQYSPKIASPLRDLSESVDYDSPDESLQMLLLQYELDDEALNSFTHQLHNYARNSPKPLKAKTILWALPQLVMKLNKSLRSYDFNRAHSLTDLTLLIMKISQRSQIRKELPQNWDSSKLARQVYKTYHSLCVLIKDNEALPLVGSLLDKKLKSPKDKHEALALAREFDQVPSEGIEFADPSIYQSWKKAQWCLIEHGKAQGRMNRLTRLLSQKSAKRIHLKQIKDLVSREDLASLELVFWINQDKPKEFAKAIGKQVSHPEFVDNAMFQLAKKLEEDKHSESVLKSIQKHPLFREMPLPNRPLTLSRAQIKLCLTPLNSNSIHAISPKTLFEIIYALEDQTKSPLDHLIHNPKFSLQKYIEQQTRTKQSNASLLFATACLMRDSSAEQSLLKALRSTLAQAKRDNPLSYNRDLLTIIGALQYLIRNQCDRADQLRRWQDAFHNAFLNSPRKVRNEIINEVINQGLGVSLHTFLRNAGAALYQSKKHYRDDTAALILLSYYELLIQEENGKARKSSQRAKRANSKFNDRLGTQIDDLDELIHTRSQALSVPPELRAMLDQLPDMFRNEFEF